MEDIEEKTVADNNQSIEQFREDPYAFTVALEKKINEILARIPEGNETPKHRGFYYFVKNLSNWINHLYACIEKTQRTGIASMPSEPEIYNLLRLVDELEVRVNDLEENN